MSERGYNARQIGLYAPEELLLKVHKKIKSSPYDRTLSAVIRALLRKWVKGEITLDD